MTHEESQRFDFLRAGPCVPVDYVRDYYGLDWPFREELLTDYETWAARLRRRTRCEGVNRYELEAFLQQHRVVSSKWMAARLGMNLDSFNLLLNHLPDLGMRQQRYEVYPGLISESLTEDIVRNLPGLRFRTFSDHNSFCERLHAELAPILGREVEKLFCATSEVVQDDPKKYANAFDCMTLEPISGRHQMWMDFQKPLNLAPDRCSKLFYSENLVALQPYRAGTQDPDLEAYQQLAEQGHG